MGTWGTGNFQDDATLDWVNSTVFQPLIRFIEDNLSSGNERRANQVVAAVDVLMILYDALDEPPPPLSRVTRWRDRYLAAWETIDWGDAVPEFIAARRQVVEKTFDRLIEYAYKVENE
jgi:hypothetical protein